MLASDWLGEPPPLERGVALAELARRYLRGHAPAGERDLAKWAGCRSRDARAALAATAGERWRACGGSAAALPARPVGPGARRLGSRDGFLEQYPRVASAEAHFRPFAWVDGRAVATWSFRSGSVTLAPFASCRAGRGRAPRRRECRCGLSRRARRAILRPCSPSLRSGSCCARATSQTRRTRSRSASPTSHGQRPLAAHFSRAFRRAFGETPHAYFLTRRLERAAGCSA